MPISGTIITYNEEDHIEGVVLSLRKVCDEVVVVDSLSTDRTVAIAESLGCTVVLQAYLGEGRQRNLTEQHVCNDWILALDADERLDEEMVESVPSLDLSDPRVAYAFNRKSYLGPHWLKGPGFYPDFVVRLYNRRESAYEPKYGHAGVTAPVVRRANGHILHYTYADISDWLAKINRFTSRDAQGMYDKGYGPSRIKPILSGLNAFIKKLVVQGGIFRGLDGWSIAVTSMFRAYMKYLKLNELHARRNAEGSSRSAR